MPTFRPSNNLQFQCEWKWHRTNNGKWLLPSQIIIIFLKIQFIEIWNSKKELKLNRIKWKFHITSGHIVAASLHYHTKIKIKLRTNVWNHSRRTQLLSSSRKWHYPSERLFCVCVLFLSSSLLSSKKVCVFFSFVLFPDSITEFRWKWLMPLVQHSTCQTNVIIFYSWIK